MRTFRMCLSSMIRARPLAAAAIVSLLILSWWPADAEAQAFGRVTLTVSDPAGTPLDGAQIRVTSSELPRFEVETETKKKGRATVAVVDATKRYQLEITLDGFQPLEIEVKPELGGTTYRELTMVPVGEGGAAEAAAATGQIAPVARLTAAERTFNEAVQALRTNDLATGKAKLLAAIEQDAELAPAHGALANVYLDEENYDAALASADHLLALAPDHANGMRARYEALQGLGRDREAKQALAKLKSLGGDGDAAAIVYNEGVNALRLGDLDGAAARFEEALEIDGQLAAALGAYAAVEMERQRYAEAAALAERLLAVEPGQERALKIRYEAYKAAGDEAKANEAFQALASSDPATVFHDLYTQGVDQFNAGDAAAARASFERCIALDPEHAKVRYHLGLTLTNLGDNAGAKAHLQRFVELAPDDPEAEAARSMIEYLQ